MNGKLFTKYYGITAIIVVLFAVIGFLTSTTVMKFFSSRVENHRAVFYAKLVDHLNQKDRIAAFKLLSDLNTGESPLRLFLLDASGKVLYPAHENIPLAWDSFAKPNGIYQDKILTWNSQSLPDESIVRFPGEQVQFLYLAHTHSRPNSTFGFFSAFTASLIISVLIGIGLSMMLFFRSIQEKSDLADRVIAQLKQGNLKARFPIKRMDEVGQAMSRFNEMADEIERLVTHLQMVEKSRMALLQELAHDLRTPVASLKNLVETADSKGDTMDNRLRHELMSLALKEIDYFERLVEDLLVMAQLTEPRYHPTKEAISLSQLLNDEAESIAAQFDANGKKVAVIRHVPAAEVNILGDAHLLRRMVRNALNNALSFSRDEVSVNLRVENGSEAKIVIEDNGPGFSDASLSTFGERRITRALGSSDGGRLSIGLGGVIIKSIAEIHGGKIQASNRASAGKVIGASLAISLPLTRAKS